MKRFKPKWIAFAAIAVLLIFAGKAALFAPAAKATSPQNAAALKPALTVSITSPKTERLPVRLAVHGNIAAWQEAIIGSESNGLRLTEVRVNVGDKVRAGQVIAVFAADAIEADVAQARASLMEAEARAADASANAARARSLKPSGALSAQEVNQYLTAEQTAKARVDAAKATLAAQQLRLKYTRLRAPDDGVISARTATVGAVVPVGTELFRMIRQGRLEWRAEVTASELGRLRTGSPVIVTAASGTELRGRVRMFAPTVDPQSRIGLVYVDLQEPSDRIAPAKAGMFAKGEFDLGTSPALTVPQQAVVMRDGFSYVFMVAADSRVSQLKVQTGRRLGDRVEVTGGIPADAQVVAGGAGFLNDGDLVRVVREAPAAR